jgi:hypothetical protein
VKAVESLGIHRYRCVDRLTSGLRRRFIDVIIYTEMCGDDYVRLNKIALASSRAQAELSESRRQLNKQQSLGGFIPFFIPFARATKVLQWESGLCPGALSIYHMPETDRRCSQVRNSLDLELNHIWCVFLDFRNI